MLIGRLLACGANWWTKGQVGLWSRWLLTDGARAGEESNQVEAVIWLPSGGCESSMMSEWVSAPPDRLMSASCHGGLPLPLSTTKSWRTVNRWQELVNRTNQMLPISTQQPTVLCRDYKNVWIISTQNLQNKIFLVWLFVCLFCINNYNIIVFIIQFRFFFFGSVTFQTV